MMTTDRFPIAIGLLSEQLARLEDDHFSDEYDTECDGCKRAFETRKELNELKNRNRGPL